jgi:hypothetical protein
MYKAKSFPVNLNELDENITDELNEPFIKKSPSLDCIEDVFDKKIKIHFEGDGPLGLRFKNIDEKMVVTRIIKNTVASEYYELKEDLVVQCINGYASKYYTYKKMLDLLTKFWSKDSEVTIVFKKEKVYVQLFYYLKNISCEEYYDEFIDLGAKDISDLSYLEYDDLVKMNMPYEKRKKISQKLGLKCVLSLPKNESEVFDFDSPKKIDHENENIELLREKMFHKK